MPNHIVNILTIGSRVDEVREFLRGAETVIDFNKIVPMPELLGKITCGYSTIDGKKVESWIDEPGPDGKPVSRLLTDDEIRQTHEIGFDSWYNWAIHHWGTKWNAYDVEEIAPNQIEFHTAWSGVTGLIEKLSARFPDVVFEYKYADEDTGHNCAEGCVSDGVAVMKYPEGGSVEAYKLAFDLRPGLEDYYELVDGAYRCREDA